MTISYGYVRGCEICRDERGWYYAEPLPLTGYGETVGTPRRHVRVDDPEGRGIQAVVDAIVERVPGRRG
ncbi:MAG: hypothetical protein IJG82_01420 [Atopobiaceae bacterium]|nr:hypothetical protein [Atopobiaceae bacterium]